MSTFFPYEAVCPSCRHRFHVELASGIHITRLPECREQILAGTFQVFSCPACRDPVAIESTTVYTDFERHHYIAVETAASVNWQAALLRHATVFEDCFGAGPPIAQEMGRRFRRRVVWGFRALREKLVIWDAGLDDHVVEAVKGDLAARRGASPLELVLRLSRVLDGGHLLFACHRPTPRPAELGAAAMVMQLPPPFDFETATADEYRRRAAARAEITRRFPWLQDDWFVDVHDGPWYLYGKP